MPQLRLVWLAALGAAIGSTGRYAVGQLFTNDLISVSVLQSENFPWDTLSVNILGALLIGFLAQHSTVINDERVRVFVVNGILGGFTTFSALAFETQELLEQPMLAIGYVSITFVVGIWATHLGTRVRQSK